MQITREMGIGAGALAFVGVVAWMVPPTTPVAPMGTKAQPGARGSAIRAPSASTLSFAGPVVAAAPYVPPAPVPVERQAEPVAIEPAPPRWREAEPDYADDEEKAAGPDQDYVAGYRWAEETGIAGRRDCRRWRGSPAEDGCRAYVRDMEEANRDEPDYDPQD
jgi:hypothetical protein